MPGFDSNRLLSFLFLFWDRVWLHSWSWPQIWFSCLCLPSAGLWARHLTVSRAVDGFWGGKNLNWQQQLLHFHKYDRNQVKTDWLFCFVLFDFFWDRVSLCSPGCPGTHFVDQAGLELRNPPASASRVLGLKACATTPGLPRGFWNALQWNNCSELVSEDGNFLRLVTGSRVGTTKAQSSEVQGSETACHRPHP
jgi:hypothetical protein